MRYIPTECYYVESTVYILRHTQLNYVLHALYDESILYCSPIDSVDGVHV